MRRIAILALLASQLSACASVHTTAKGVLGGGLVGAGLGAAAVAIGGGAIATGVAIGGVVGAAAGGYVGCRNSHHCR